MRVRILGSAAGGGLPQWNCGCANCASARCGDPAVRARTQSSVALSADGASWFLLNVSADVRAQVTALAELWPPASQPRGTTIAGCLLTDAEIDHTSGLLQLREGCAFPVYATRLVERWLSQHFPIAPMLAPFVDRPWIEIPLEQRFELPAAGAPSGLRAWAFELRHEVPRFVPREAEPIGSRIGLEIEDLATGGRLVYAPGISEINSALQSAAERADCVLVDGTFWSDDEPRRMGITKISATEMGHLPISGEEVGAPGSSRGTLAWLAKLPARHRAYVHMNNTNPVLNETSREYRAVVEQGIQVTQDGDLFEI